MADTHNQQNYDPHAPSGPDPYAPPPRHKDRSGAVVRVVLIAGMIGAAVWGYTQYASTSPEPLVAQQEQQVAENDYDPDVGYRVNPNTLDDEQAPPSTATPAPDMPPPANPEAAPASPG